jgi:hypothetical protein
VLLSGVSTADTDNSSRTFTACSDFDNAANDLEFWESNPTMTNVTDINSFDPITGAETKIGTRTETTTNACSCE